MKIRKKTLVFVSFALAFASLESYSSSQKVKNVNEDYVEIVEEADCLFAKHYNPRSLGEGLNSLEFKKSVSSQGEEGFEDEEVVQITKDYWRIALESLYSDLDDYQKKTLEDLRYQNTEFEYAFDALTGVEEEYVEDEVEELKSKTTSLNNKIMKIIGAGTASAAFAMLSSMISGILSSSWIPFVGWAIAIVLVAALIIYIVADWSYIREGFDDFIAKAKNKNPRIANLLSEAKDKAEKEAKDNPDVAEDATKPSKMREQLEKDKKLKREIDYVDDADESRKVKPHVHFKDGTSLNWDGTIHDKGHGKPSPSRYVWDWLHRNGWCQNGIK